MQTFNFLGVKTPFNVTVYYIAEGDRKSHKEVKTITSQSNSFQVTAYTYTIVLVFDNNMLFMGDTKHDSVEWVRSYFGEFDENSNWLAYDRLSTNQTYNLTVGKRRHLIHKNSSVKGKTINKDIINYGEIAINYASGDEQIQIKNSDDSIIVFDRLLSEYESGFNTVTSVQNLPTDKRKIYVQVQGTPTTQTLSLQTNLSKAFERYGELEIYLYVMGASSVTLNLPTDNKWKHFNGNTFVLDYYGHTLLKILKIGDSYLTSVSSISQ